MSTSQKIRDRLGANMRESIGVDRPGVTSDTPAPSQQQDPPMEMGRRRMRVQAIELAKIDKDEKQPRTDFDQGEMEILVESLKQHGQIQLCEVRHDRANDKYIIVTGERRFRAAQAAGFATLNCVVINDENDQVVVNGERRTLSPLDVLGRQIAENLHRADLKPMEKARIYHQLHADHNWNVRDIAKFVGVGIGSVSDDMKLLGLPASLQAEVDSGRLPKSAAAAIADLPNEADQRELAGQAMSGKATRDEIKDEAKRRKRSTVEQGKDSAESKGKGRGPAKPTKALPRTEPRKEDEFKSKRHKITINATAQRSKLDMNALVDALDEYAWQIRSEMGYKPQRHESEDGLIEYVEIDPRLIQWGVIDPHSLPNDEVLAIRRSIEAGQPYEPLRVYGCTPYWIATGVKTLAAILSMFPIPRTVLVQTIQGGWEDAAKLARAEIDSDTANAD